MDRVSSIAHCSHVSADDGKDVKMPAAPVGDEKLVLLPRLLLTDISLEYLTHFDPLLPVPPEQASMGRLVWNVLAAGRASLKMAWHLVTELLSTAKTS